VVFGPPGRVIPGHLKILRLSATAAAAAGSHARGLGGDPASPIRMTSRGISGFLSSRTANSAANSSVA
jgi:hypothetical protein